MKKSWMEKRKYPRYDTEVKIYFHVNYDIKTRVKFQLKDKTKNRLLRKKYSAISRNVSAEGLSFISSKLLRKGDTLYLEVYLPGRKNPIRMEGIVAWSQGNTSSKPTARYKFETGIKLLNVDGQSVSESIIYDTTHQVVWSIVLENIFGSFRIFAKKKTDQKNIDSTGIFQE